MADRKLNWLDRFFVTRDIRANGTDVPHRGTLNFVGAGVVVSDHEPEDETRVDIGAALTGTEVTSAVAGAADALPVTPAGYLEIPINGVLRRVPFY